MKKRITIEEYGYALDGKNREFFRTIHYVKTEVRTDSGDYMKIKENYGYNREDYELANWMDQVECQLYNLSYTYGLVLDLLAAEEYDEVEFKIVWGGKPKRAMAVVTSPDSNYSDAKARKRTFVLDVRRKIAQIQAYLDTGRVTITEDNVKDMYHLSKVSRDGYKYNRAVALSVNKGRDGKPISKDIVDEYDLKDVIEQSRDLSSIARARRDRKKVKQNSKAIDIGLQVQYREAQAQGKDTTYVESLIDAKHAENAQNNDINTYNKDYNYLATIPVADAEWVKNCYLDILHKLADGNSDIVLITSRGNKLHKTDAMIKNDIKRIEQGIIRYHINTMYVVDALEYEDEYNDASSNYFAFNFGTPLKDYIDNYDANDISF